MKNKFLDTLLKSNTTLITSLVLGLIFGLGHIFTYLVSETRPLPLTLIINIFIMLSIISIFVSYIGHNKNVMKFSLGSLLTLVVVGLVIIITIESINIFLIVLLVLSLCIYIIHMLINAERHSSPLLVKLNQITFILYLIVTLIIDVYIIINLPSVGYMLVLSLVCSTMLYLAAILLCIFVESNLDYYRILREEKGWKE